MGGSGTASQFALRAVVETLRARAIAIEPVFRASGLAPELATIVDARFPFDRALALWEHAATVLGDPDFGLHAAAQLADGYSLLDYILVTSPTVLEGYQRLSAFVRIAYDESDLHVELDREPGAFWLVRTAGPHGRHYDEFLVGFLVGCGRRASGIDWQPRSIAFAHAAPADVAPAAAMFRCPITYGAPAIVIAIDRAIGDAPSCHVDTPLHAILEDYGRSLLAKLPDPRDLAASVRAAILRALPKRLPAIEGVARELKMSGRSLQRRLAESSTSFATILDEIRRELALQYLANARLSVGEVTYLLHFSEVAAFARAFKRWMRVTPAEYRTRLFGEA